MATPAAHEIDRPLRLGEVLAAAIRVFNARPWPYLALGVLEAGVFLLANTVDSAAGLPMLAVSFVAAFAVVVRLVVGDRFAPAWRRVAGAAPVLLALAFVVAVPFYLGFALGLVLLLFSAAWLGLTAFAIPAAMVEQPREPGWLAATVYALQRTKQLAATEYVHALSVSAVLLVVYVLVGIALAIALQSYADNSRLVAQALVQIVLTPFFFISLTILYFDQRARALESAGKPGKRG
jgi:hypothetical protein